jgi:hypothetical protein
MRMQHMRTRSHEILAQPPELSLQALIVRRRVLLSARAERCASQCILC